MKHNISYVQSIFDEDDVWLIDQMDNTRFIDGVEFYLGIRMGDQRKRKLLIRKESYKNVSKSVVHSRNANKILFNQ